MTLRSCIDKVIHLHTLKHLIQLENCLNKRFLKYYRTGKMFEEMSGRLLKLYRKQAYWLVRNNTNSLEEYFNQNECSYNIRELIVDIIKKYEKRFKNI